MMAHHKITSAVTLTIIAGILLTVSGCSKGGKALVRVGNASITEGDLETLARVNPRLKPRLGSPDGKQKVLENYVDQELLFQESVRRGLARSQPVKEKIALYEKIIVAQALLDNELDRRVKEYYDSHQDEFERVKISHLLVRVAAEKAEEKKDDKPDTKKGKDAKKEEKKPEGHSEADALKLAEQARDRLMKGEDFGKVAQEISEDEKTKKNQGDLGYVTIHDKKLERWGWLPLAEKAFALKTGETSDVIKTKDGFHVVKVTEDKKVQSFAEAEAGIKFRMQADIRNQILDDLKKRYKVEYTKAEAPAKKPASPHKDKESETKPVDTSLVPQPGGAPESAPTETP